MSESTPGPWHAVIAPNDQPSLLYAGIISTLFYSPDDYVAVVSDEPLGMRDETSLLEECQANARLIAAAPILKAALTWAVEYMEKYEGEVMPGWREFQARGRAALAASEPPLSGEAGQ